MDIAMRNVEIALLEYHLKQARSYFEFGCGGSTALARSYVSDRIVSVDSSKEWINKVQTSCPKGTASLDLKWVDIGPTRDWGHPSGSEHKHKWINYSLSAMPGFDFYLIDGRFRVACFICSLIVSEKGSLIAVHDFESRTEYHIIRSMCVEIAQAGDLSIFVKNDKSDLISALRLYDRYKCDPT